MVKKTLGICVTVYTQYRRVTGGHFAIFCLNFAIFCEIGRVCALLKRDLFAITFCLWNKFIIRRN